MSRIHEALKKAQQERSAAMGPDLIVSQHAPFAAPPSWEEESSDAAAADGPGQVPESVAFGMNSAEHLRFEDVAARCAHPRWQPDPNLDAFRHSGLSSQAAEQFRTLRSRLYQLRNDQPLRTIVVSSAMPAEGKTFVASNLAQSIVRQPDRRALLIDADLRCARLHIPMGAPRSPGLTEYLRGEADEMAIIQKGEEGNLCLIAGGGEVANPSELLLNGRLKGLLERVAPVFDWVILDSPPCLPVADASALAGLCDGVLFVVRAGSTPCELGQKAIQEFRGRNIVGVVLNGVGESESYAAYYYGGYGSGADHHETVAR